MFTGIVDHTGIITEVTSHGRGVTFRIESRFEGIAEGESIAVDGCCLTAVGPANGAFRCDLSTETLGLTAFADCRPGRRVNLERALRLGDRLGGHFVTGHVDQTGTVARRVEEGECLRLVFTGVTPAHRAFLHKKGSVAVQGVSLTVNAVTADGFEVALIPHTLERTTLATLREGDRVHLEFDWMTKVILTNVAEWRAAREAGT